MKIRNSATGQLPRVYYGLHSAEGVAEYADEKTGKHYRVLLLEDALKKMDPSFRGKPAYVEHVEKVNVQRIQEEADGYVFESFFNEADSKHWVMFIVVSDEGHEAMGKGWVLSNCYTPSKLDPGGKWHGVDYVEEILDGVYEHLAFVPNPRYQESVVMTPEQFKQYNETCRAELARLKNDADDLEEGDKGMKNPFQFFAKEKHKNSEELSGLSVLLPQSKVEVSVERLVNDADERELHKNDAMADLKHNVKLHDGTMCNVGELLEKHKTLSDAYEDLKVKHDALAEKVNPNDDDANPAAPAHKEDNPANDDDDDADDADVAGDESTKKKALEIAEHEEAEQAAAQKKNQLKIAKLRNALNLKPREETALATAKAKALRNAAEIPVAQVIETAGDELARGKALYGSGSKK